MNCGRAPTAPATTPGSGEAGYDPFLRQGSLELCQGAEDMEQELALRRGGIHLLGQ